ncbi:MAG: hypothetical protein IPK68_22245 [Bdellovibrionales bacterium]|nr:hypothetical protein [Bdellovibrionales bacterium]
MKKWKRLFIIPFLVVSLTTARPARADFWGGDLVYLAQILQTAIQQLTQLQNILGNGRDTLNLLRDINRGLREALNVMRTANQTLRPGVLSDLDNLDLVLAKVEELYGRIPNTPEGKMQLMTDRSVAEAINLHNEAFKYADRLDPEAERIKDYAHMVNPAGAAKVTVQSMGMMIHVLNQILRTNAAILKLQSEQLALQNRRGKLDSEQFRMQYEGVSDAFGNLRSNFNLPSISR